MQGLWFFLSVFFGIMGGYFVLRTIYFAVTETASKRYRKRRGKRFCKRME